MDSYEEIMKYKISNYSMIVLQEKTQESIAEQTQAIIYCPDTENRNNKTKEFSFEQLVNEHLIVDQDLFFSSELAKSFSKMENDFGVMEIEILKVIKLKLQESHHEMILDRKIKFRFFKNRQNFVLEISHEGNIEIINFKGNKHWYQPEDDSFFAYLDQTKNELTIQFIKLDDFLTVTKSEIRFEINENEQIWITMDSSHKVEARGTNENIIFVKERDGYKCKCKTAVKSSKNPCYLLKYFFKKREIDGYFNIQNDKFFNYLKEISLEFETKIQNEEEHIDLQVIMNFDIDEKKETIKYLILEAKSSTNNFGKTVNQFTHHLSHLATDAKEMDETLFLLYIQNDPTKNTVQIYRRLLENKKKIAIILISHKRFNKLPFISKGEIAKKHSLMSKNINNFFYNHSETLSSNSNSQHPGIANFLELIKIKKNENNNKFGYNNLCLDQENFGNLSSLQENDASVGNAEIQGAKILESNLRGQISLNNFSKNQMQLISWNNNKDLIRLDEDPFKKLSDLDKFSNSKIDYYSKENESLKENMKNCVIENEYLNKKLKDSLSQIDFLNRNYNILLSEKEDLRKKLDDYSLENRNMMKENYEFKNKNGELDWKLQSSNSENQRLSQQLNDCSVKCEILVKENNEYKNRNGELDRTLQSSKSEIEKLNQKLNDCSLENRNIMKENNEFKNKNGELDWKLQSSKSEIEKMNQKLKDYENRAGFDKWLYIILPLLIAYICMDKYYGKN